MRHNIPTTPSPDQPSKLYMRCMYHTFFYGPFDDEEAVIRAIVTLGRADPYWDDDGRAILWGSNPLPKDMAFGHRFVGEDMLDRILNAARAEKR
jgi:hypothetical protein